MGRPILNPSTPISKRRPLSSLRHLSASLHSAATNLRDASSTARDASSTARDRRLSAINSAYRHAFRAAVALHTEHGASPSPSSPSTLPSLSPSPVRIPRSRDYDLERLLRRSERLPRLPLPAALRGPMADLAARSAQLVQQRRQLDQAAADMRELHERLLADMERTAQHFVDAAHSATGVHGPGPNPPATAAPRPVSRRPLPAGVIRARVRAAVSDLPAAFRAAARAAREADERPAATQGHTRSAMLTIRTRAPRRRNPALTPAPDADDTPVRQEQQVVENGEGTATSRERMNAGTGDGSSREIGDALTRPEADQ